MNVTSCVKEGIIKAINPVGGVSKSTGNSWTKTNVVLDFSSPNKVRVLEIPFWGEFSDMVAQQYKVGQRVRIAFDVEGREWQGKIYPELRGFAIEPVADTLGAAMEQTQPMAYAGGVGTACSVAAEPQGTVACGAQPSMAENRAGAVGGAAGGAAGAGAEEGIPF